MKKRVLIAASVIVLFLLAGILFVTSPLFAVTPLTEDIIIEAGKKPSGTPSDYLNGQSWCVGMSYVDTSDVQHKKVGEYPVYIYHGFKKYVKTVRVTDTTAPTLQCNVKKTTVKKDKRLTVNGLGAEAYDVTGVDRLLFQHIVAEEIFVPTGTDNKESLDYIYLVV